MGRRSCGRCGSQRGSRTQHGLESSCCGAAPANVGGEQGTGRGAALRTPAPSHTLVDGTGAQGDQSTGRGAAFRATAPPCAPADGAGAGGMGGGISEIAPRRVPPGMGNPTVGSIYSVQSEAGCRLTGAGSDKLTSSLSPVASIACTCPIGCTGMGEFSVPYSGSEAPGPISSCPGDTQ